jgi:hypothetical protein
MEEEKQEQGKKKGKKKTHPTNSFSSIYTRYFMNAFISFHPFLFIPLLNSHL